MTQQTLSRPRLVGHAACKNLDPGQFASSIRQLAVDAHRVLKDPFASSDQLKDLSKRIDVLRRTSPMNCSSAVARWLRSVEGIIDSRDSVSD